MNGNIQSSTNTFLSDRKFKKNINSIENGVSIINSLNPVTYNWKVEDFKDIAFNNTLQSGFKAQELEKVLPNLVQTNDEGKSVNYIQIIPYLTQSIKELSKEIEILKNELDNLKSKSTVIFNNINESQNLINIAPNPTKGELLISYSIEIKEPLSMILFDFSGKIIKTIQLNGGKSESINISDLKMGNYIYKVFGKNTSFEGKIIKQ